MGGGNQKSWEYRHSVSASATSTRFGLLQHRMSDMMSASGHRVRASPEPTLLRLNLSSLCCLCQEHCHGDKKLAYCISYLILWGHLYNGPSARLTTIMRFFFHRLHQEVFSFQGSWQGCWSLAVMHILTVSEFLLRICLSKGGGCDRCGKFFMSLTR